MNEKQEAVNLKKKKKKTLFQSEMYEYLWSVVLHENEKSLTSWALEWVCYILSLKHLYK